MGLRGTSLSDSIFQAKAPLQPTLSEGLYVCMYVCYILTPLLSPNPPLPSPVEKSQRDNGTERQMTKMTDRPKNYKNYENDKNYKNYKFTKKGQKE